MLMLCNKPGSILCWHTEYYILLIPRDKPSVGAFKPHVYLKRELVGLKLTLHKWKSAWKVAFSLVKVTPRLFCRNSFVLLAPNIDHACEWNRCAALQVPWKWLPIAFTDNIQVSKDTLTEMLHLPLSKVRNKCDDCSSKYLQKNLPAVLAGRKMSVPTNDITAHHRQQPEHLSLRSHSR